MYNKNLTIKRKFPKFLLQWHKKFNNRQMPWKGEKDMYKIWLSEIILQQTRVDQGMAYYNRFLLAYPSVEVLAAAKDQDVMKLWEGLGYYSRCRNLLATARFIVSKKAGIFPKTYQELLMLKGVGPYTAAALASFGLNQPHAVIDGNVIRVLARYFGIYENIQTPTGRKIFSDLARELIDIHEPGVYNQAIMDFGATVCKPLAPLCTSCIMQKVCYAYQHQKTAELPVKQKKLIKKQRWFYYLLVEVKDALIVRVRKQKDIWQHLNEFILLESGKALSKKQILASREFIDFVNLSDDLPTISKVYSQQLTHQTIFGKFIEIKLNKKPALNGYQLKSKKSIQKLAFPGFINKYLSEKQRIITKNR